MLVMMMYLATSMTRPRCPWPPLPHVEGMVCMLAQSLLVSSFKEVLVGVLVIGIRHRCRKVSIMDGIDMMELCSC